VGGIVHTPQCAWHAADAAGQPTSVTTVPQPDGSGP
jgi:hypothetical protein